MIYEHHTHPALLAEPVTLALVGAGGNGSQMLTGLARLHTSIRALGHPGLEVIVYDPDDVSEANLGRQLFAPADVGRSKATVLVTRVNAWYGTRWAAVPTRYQSSPEGDINIIVTCVDSAAARVAIGRTIQRQNGGGTYYWLDLGNRAADGQAILGIPAQDEQHEAYAFRLPTVLELFPELAADAARLDRDDAPSCSLAQALERQELFVNQAVVTPALQLLWQIFRYGRTTWCGAFVNLRSGRMSPLPVDPDAWERFGHHAGRMRQTHWSVDAKGRKTVHERRHPMSEEHRALLEDHAREQDEALEDSRRQQAEAAATIEVTT